MEQAVEQAVELLLLTSHEEIYLHRYNTLNTTSSSANGNDLERTTLFVNGEWQSGLLLKT